MIGTLSKWVAILLIVGGFILLFPFESLDQELESTNVRKSNCEIVRIAELLNQEYSKNFSYPNNSEFANFVLTHINDIQCGRIVPVSDVGVIDPWGSPYCYKIGSRNAVTIYSADHIPSDKEGSARPLLRLELREGQTHRLESRFPGHKSCDT